MKRILYFIIAICIIGISACNSNKDPFTKIEISTDYGKMVFKLYDETPLHRDNFIKLVKDGWFEGSPFHRVIEGFMIQGGGQGDREYKDSAYTIPAEFRPNLFHKKGVLAAARMGDDVNPNKESSYCQFYIVQGKGSLTDEEIEKFEDRAMINIPEEHRKVYRKIGGTPHLDQNYTVFGEIISGLDVVDRIASVETTTKGRMRNTPIKDVKMSIRIID